MKPLPLDLLMTALCCLPQPGFGQIPPPTPVGEDSDTALLLVEIELNGEEQEGQFLVARNGQRWLMKPPDLARFRLGAEEAGAVTVEGERFTPLPAAIAATFDDARQLLRLTVPAQLFRGQQLAASGALLQPTQSSFAAFLNYDIALERQDGTRASGFFEAGISDHWGVAATTFQVGQSGGPGRAVRLDSYYLYDDPQRLLRLLIGDGVTASLDWSRQVRFGGVRLGTEFGLRPELVTFSTPTFVGRTAVPSNVELLVNDAIRFQGAVDQGPFSISQVPLVTGAGEVTLVLRDALGVERRVRTRYYVSPRLLARGLSAWSLEAGAEREDYGLRSFAYRNAFVAGTYRRGVTDWLTLEGRAEASGEVRMGGGGLSAVWAPLGEFGVALAGSQGRDGRGGLYRLFFSRITPSWNVALSYQRATRHFDQLGIDSDRDRITRQFQATTGLSLRRLGNLAVGWSDLGYADGSRARLASANYSIGVMDKAYFSLFAIRSDVEGAGRETTFGLGLTIPLGQRTSAYVQADRRNRLAELRQTPPSEGGWGYRLSATLGADERQQAELRWRGGAGEMSLEAARSQGEVGLRFLASGGLLLAGGEPHATRRVEGGFGLVEVPGQGDVRIYQENRLVARTNANGRAIIPDLRAYEANRLSLAPSDLPLEAAMADDSMIVVPRFRGGVLARFAVEQDAPATVIVTMPDGQLVEVGASVRLPGGAQSFVGRGGEIFIADLREPMMVNIDTAEGACRVTLPAVPPGESLPQIGPIACRLGGGQP